MAFEFSSLMLKLGVNMRGLSTSLVSASGKIKGFVDSNNLTIQRLGTKFVAVGAAIVGGLALAVKAAADFETAITNTASVTGQAGEELEKTKVILSELARELGATTVFSATEAANAMYDLASKGFDPAKMSIAELQPFLDLASATQAELGQATETVTATIRAFGLSTKDSGKVADIFTKVIGSSAARIDKLQLSMTYLAPTARTAGLSLEETAAALGKVYDLGFEASTAGTSLRRTLTTLQKPSAKLTEFLEKQNLAMADVDVRTHGLAGVLKNLDGTAATTAETIKLNAEVLKLFGDRAGPVVNALMSVDSEGKKLYETMDILKDKLEKSVGEAARVAEEQLKTFWNQLKLVWSKIQEVAITIGNKLLPELTKMAEKVERVVGAIGEWMKENPELTKTIVTLIAKFALLTIGLGLLMKAFKPLLFVFSPLAKGLFGLIGHLAKTQLGVQGLTNAAAAAKIGVFKLIGVTALWTAGIGLLILEIAVLVKSYWDMKAAQEELSAAQEKGAKTLLLNIDNQMKKLKTLEDSYASLTDKEKEKIEAEKAHLENIKGLIRMYQQENGSNIITIEQGQEILKMLGLRGEAINKLKGYITSLNKVEADKRAKWEAEDIAAEASLIVQREKNQAMLDAEMTLRTLNLRLVEGQIKQQEYATGTEQVKQALTELTGSADEAQKMMDKINKTDPNIEMVFKTTGVEQHENITKRIRSLNQQVVLNQLEGDARRIQSIKFELANYLEAIKAKEEAEKIHHEKVLNNIKVLLAAKIAEVKSNAVMETEIGRQLLEKNLARQKKIFAEYSSVEDERFNKSLDLYKRESDLFTQKQDIIIQKLDEKKQKQGEVADDAVRQVDKEVNALDTLISGYDRASNAASRGGVLGGTTYGRTADVLSGGGVSFAGGAETKVEVTVPKSWEQFMGGGSGSGYGVLGFQSGTKSVPRTGMFKLHEGEEVVPAVDVRRGKNDGGVTIINLISEDMLQETMMKHPDAIINIVNADIVSHGITRKIIKGLQ